MRLVTLDFIIAGSFVLEAVFRVDDEKIQVFALTGQTKPDQIRMFRSSTSMSLKDRSPEALISASSWKRQANNEK